jgi:hypothetical protein
MKNIHLLPTDKPSRLYYKDDNYKLANRTIAIDWYISSAGYKPTNIYTTSDEEIKDEDYCVHTNQSSIIKIGEGEGKLMKEHLYLKKIILTTDQDLIADGVQAIDDKFLEWFVKNPSCEEVKIINNETGNYREFDSTPNLLYKIIIPQEEPKQYPIGGYAPGYYSCTCVTCKKEFTGDKRAVQCEPCAIQMTKEEPKQLTDLEIAVKLEEIQREEPKQETLEEAAKKTTNKYINEREKQTAYLEFIEGHKWTVKRMYSEEEVKNIAIQYFSHYYNISGRGRLMVEHDLKWFEQFKKKT